MKSQYEKLVKKCGKEFLDFVSENHAEYRLRYLAYRLRGDDHENAVECTNCDVYEGNDDANFSEWTQAKLDLVSFLAVFSSPEEVGDAIYEFYSQYT